MEIRSARIADTDAVNELLVQLGYPGGGRSTTAERIRSWVDDPTRAVLVADADGDVLGVIAVQICPFFERDGAWARITALVVADRARRQGVGARLVEAAEEFAAGHGCIRVEVTSADRRHDAHSFYKRRGYADQTGTSTRFLRDLPQ
ncbi:GNAT family N-acetyltransferase [Pseudonocardia sp. CA-107938]|uniref:GNAT family N-acetyltransferase n=1 Tax=Pseudonocardia sp. CA-107938 TaxID=3240021 RepID=UPI003D8C0B1E